MSFCSPVIAKIAKSLLVGHWSPSSLPKVYQHVIGHRQVCRKFTCRELVIIKSAKGLPAGHWALSGLPQVCQQVTGHYQTCHHPSVSSVIAKSTAGLGFYPLLSIVISIQCFCLIPRLWLIQVRELHWHKVHCS